MATDLELIKQVQVTAFDHFSEGYFLPDDYLKIMGLQLGLLDARGHSGIRPIRTCAVLDLCDSTSETLQKKI